MQRVRHDDAKLFQVEEEALALQAAGVTHQSAVGTDDPVARHDHGDRISRVRHTDVAREPGVAQLRGKLPVRARLPVGNALQQRPHALLERVPARRERQLEPGAFTAEVFVELADGIIEAGIVARARHRPHWPPAAPVETDPREHTVMRHERQRAERRVADRVRDANAIVIS